MQYQYISINSVFSKLIRDATNEFSEDDIIEWCAESLEFIGAVKAYEEAIAFIEIKNHQGKLPLGLHQIIQLARNNNYTNYKKCTPLTICEKAPEACGLTVGQNPCVCPPSDAVWLDCNGQPIVAYDLAYYRPYFDLKTEYNTWHNSSYYNNNFTPIRLANHTLFGTLVTPDKGIGYTQTVDSYTVILDNIIRTSFRSGQVCVAYYRQVRDKDGYPMIPDHISYRTAITKYIQMKMADKDFQNGRDGAEKRLSKYESDWHWYCKQAGNASMMLNGIDEHQNLLDQRTTLIPNFNKYYGFFGNLSKPEIGYPYSEHYEGYEGCEVYEGCEETPVIYNTPYKLTHVGFDYIFDDTFTL